MMIEGTVERTRCLTRDRSVDCHMKREEAELDGRPLIKGGAL